MAIFNGCRFERSNSGDVYSDSSVLPFSTSFPIREYGVNFESQPLQAHEIRSMKADPVIIERVMVSYELMLDFFGMRLVSRDSGLVDRALPPRNFSARYRNLVRQYYHLTRLDNVFTRLP